MLKIFLMLNTERSDITGGLIVAAAGVTVFAVVALAFKYVFRNFTLRKELPVGSPYGRFGRFPKVAGLTATPVTPARTPTLSHSPVPASTPASGDVTPETSPINASDTTPWAAMLTSEEELCEDWISPEEDKAWANL